MFLFYTMSRQKSILIRLYFQQFKQKVRFIGFIDMSQYIHYWLGKHWKFYRYAYWRSHGNNYIWGLYKFGDDMFGDDSYPIIEKYLRKYKI